MTRDIARLTPIAPMYVQSKADEPINLGTASIRLTEEGEPDLDVEATFAIVFEPREKLEIRVPGVAHSRALRWFFSEDESSLQVRMAGMAAPLGVYAGETFDEGVIFHPRTSPLRIDRSQGPLVVARFHLFNWPDLNGPEDYVLKTGAPPYEGSRVCGRFTCKAEGWVIGVAETENADDLIKQVRAKDGYAITHAGTIERDDGGTFGVEELDDIVTCLHYYFSFALGRWAGPQLVVGLDANGQRASERWGLGKFTRGWWNAGITWMDSRHAELISQVFPGFYARWKSETWRKPLTEALYWYVNAGQVGHGVNVDSALLFTQAAMELLAWTYCVKDRQMLSESAFGPRGLSAADKLRVLASSLGIPLTIPQELKALNGKRGKKWRDSMDALTSLRNGLVHPTDDRDVPKGAYVEGWKLSMWYLDLMLLALCRHSGKYSNRTKRSPEGVENVPWTANAGG